MTIEEGNKFIAEFMGGELCDVKQNNVYWFKDYHHILTTHKAINQHAFKYHSSWDWLMPVVQKSYISVDALTWYSSDLTLFDLGINADIKTVYEAVVQFIQWYNQQKEKQ